MSLITREPSPSSLTSNAATMMHIIKGNVGTGILAMPFAFKNAGLAIGTGGIFFVGLICIHCMQMLVKCQEALCQRLNFPFLDYEDVAEKSLEVGPSKLQRYSSTFRKTIIMFLFITQYGFCCVYAFFVAESISNVIFNLFQIKIHHNLIMLMFWPLMVAVNMVRSLKHLAYASAAANVLQLAGLVQVLFNLIQDLPSTRSVRAVGDLSNLPLYFGTAVYAFEGIGIILPIKKDMSEPDALGGKVGVLNTSMTIVSALYTAVGFFGYLKFGDFVQSNIALNLDRTPANEVIRIMFAFAIFLSYPLQFYVPFNILWPVLVEKYDLRGRSMDIRIQEYLLRGILVTLTFCLAAVVPKLDLFISLVGAFSSSCLALIFPPLIQTLVFWDADQCRSARVAWIIKNLLIFIFGLLIFVIGTHAAMREIILSFGDVKDKHLIGA